MWKHRSGLSRAGTCEGDRPTVWNVCASAEGAMTGTLLWEISPLPVFSASCPVVSADNRWAHQQL